MPATVIPLPTPHHNERMTEEEFVASLYRHSSTGRPWRVLDWAMTLDPSNAADAASFWRVVVNEWSGFDAIPHEDFAGVFETFRDTAPGAPELPNRFTAYRGQDHDADPGLSWTLDRAVAEQFARGHRIFFNPKPHVFKLTVTREQVAFFTNERNEAEVVLLDLPDFE